MSGDEVDECDQLIFLLDHDEEADDVNQLCHHLLHTAISLSRSAQGSTRPADAGWAHHLLEYWVGTGELPELVSLPCKLDQAAITPLRPMRHMQITWLFNEEQWGIHPMSQSVEISPKSEF